MRSNLNEVLEYLNQIIRNPTVVAAECYQEAMSTAKYWCEFSSKTFIPNEAFISHIFEILDTPSSSLKVIKILRRLLIKSKYVKILENTTFD